MTSSSKNPETSTYLLDDVFADLDSTFTNLKSRFTVKKDNEDRFKNFLSDNCVKIKFNTRRFNFVYMDGRKEKDLKISEMKIRWNQCIGRPEKNESKKRKRTVRDDAIKLRDIMYKFIQKTCDGDGMDEKTVNSILLEMKQLFPDNSKSSNTLEEEKESEDQSDQDDAEADAENHNNEEEEGEVSEDQG